LSPASSSFSPNSSSPSKTVNTAEDRRRSERFPFSAVAEVVDTDSHTRINARVSDISRHGCYLDVINVFAAGTIVQLSIQHASLQLDVTATVVYSLPGMGMGLAFKPLSGPMESVLRRWVSGVEVEPAIEEDAPEASQPNQDYRRLERHILGRLIGLMMQKNMLTNDEGTELLDELLREE
jgi:hypothetical protein